MYRSYQEKQELEKEQKLIQMLGKDLVEKAHRYEEYLALFSGRKTKKRKELLEQWPLDNPDCEEAWILYMEAKCELLRSERFWDEWSIDLMLDLIRSR